jgi:asparagine synthase (glutamine-hydrolysing)
LRSELPAAVLAATPLERAGWLERKTLLEPYLLSAQADRVSMAHGVEGRFPFLDHRVFSLAARLPPDRKLDGMRDKAVLRDLARQVLPETIADRVKQPYRAPEVEPFFGEGAPRWVDELLSEGALRETGFWDPQRVAGLVRRCRAGRARGVREGMALIGVLTTQLWHRNYFGDLRPGFEAESAEPNVRMDLTTTTRTEGS